MQSCATAPPPPPNIIAPRSLWLAGWDFCSHGGDDRTDGEVACLGTTVGVRRVFSPADLRQAAARHWKLRAAAAFPLAKVSPRLQPRTPVHARQARRCFPHREHLFSLTRPTVSVPKAHSRRPSRITLELRMLRGSDAVACSGGGYSAS